MLVVRLRLLVEPLSLQRVLRELRQLAVDAAAAHPDLAKLAQALQFRLEACLVPLPGIKTIISSTRRPRSSLYSVIS